MLYPFQSADGELIELEYDPNEAPEFGTVVVGTDGRTYRRIFGDIQIHGVNEGSSNFPRFESNQLPKWWAHHKGEFGPTGKPRYTNRREIDEDMARARHEGTEISYGDL